MGRPFLNSANIFFSVPVVQPSKPKGEAYQICPNENWLKDWPKNKNNLLKEEKVKKKKKKGKGETGNSDDQQYGNGIRKSETIGAPQRLQQRVGRDGSGFGIIFCWVCHRLLGPAYGSWDLQTGAEQLRYKSCASPSDGLVCVGERFLTCSQLRDSSANSGMFSTGPGPR